MEQKNSRKVSKVADLFSSLKLALLNPAIYLSLRTTDKAIIRSERYKKLVKETIKFTDLAVTGSLKRVGNQEKLQLWLSTKFRERLPKDQQLKFHQVQITCRQKLLLNTDCLTMTCSEDDRARKETLIRLNLFLLKGCMGNQQILNNLLAYSSQLHAPEWMKECIQHKKS